MDDKGETMTNDFTAFYQWVNQNLGLDLHAYKEKQLQRRILTVMKAAGADNLTDYMPLLNKDLELRQQLLDYMTINVTEFYRNPEIFSEFERVLVEYLVPEFKELKIWSAACSIGAEPYTLAMIASKQKIPLSHKILATDIDRPILARAKAGVYKESELKNVSPADREMFFTTENNLYHLQPSLKEKVRFKEHDLLQSEYEGNFQAIICRNVTIYFKTEARDEIYRKFHQALVPGGIFFAGATETISNPGHLGFKKLSTFIYQKI